MNKFRLALLIVVVGVSLLVSSIIPSQDGSSKVDSLGCAPIPSGLIYWLQAENNADDYTNLHDGLPSGGMAYSSGMVGNSFLFDGNDNVVIPSATDLPSGADPRTLEMWVYTIEESWVTNTHSPFFSGENSDRKAFGIDFDVYPTLEFFTWADDLIVTTSLAKQGWFHLAFVYDGATLVTAYINGSPVGSHVLGGALVTTLSDHFIGSGVDASGDPVYFIGRLDEVSFYNKALTEAEILQIYQAFSAGKCKFHSTYLPMILKSGN